MVGFERWLSSRGIRFFYMHWIVALVGILIVIIALVRKLWMK